MIKAIYKVLMILAGAVIIGSCAKSVSESSSKADQRYFKAWLSVNAPDAVRAGRGIYVYPESIVEGTGATVEKDGFAIVRYLCTDLEGNITSYTDSMPAEQLGIYSPSSYYGVQVMTTTDETIRAGISDAIVGMKVGGKKKFIVPAWLMSYENYSSENEFLKKEIDQESSIFEMEIVDFTKNINNWQLSRMEECFNNPDFFDGIFAGKEIRDSTTRGFYFKMIETIESQNKFPEDTTIYINYTGSLLKLPKFYGDGLVFDTSIENIAKINNIYNSSRTYEPCSVKWGKTHSDIKMSGSTLVSGFTQTLWNMVNCAPGTKAVGVFFSDLGYGHNGSGEIPSYAPLAFEIEIVEKPE